MNSGTLRRKKEILMRKLSFLATFAILALGSPAMAGPSEPEGLTVVSTTNDMLVSKFDAPAAIEQPLACSVEQPLADQLVELAIIEFADNSFDFTVAKMTDGTIRVDEYPITFIEGTSYKGALCPAGDQSIQRVGSMPKHRRTDHEQSPRRG